MLDDTTKTSPLRELYSEWQTVKELYNAASDRGDESDADALFSRMVSLEQQAADYEPQTTEDFAFKVIFADDNGDMDMNPHQRVLVARCYEMVGIKPRHQIDAPSVVGEISQRPDSAATDAPGLYREWSQNRAEWYRLAEAGEDWEGPEMSSLRERRYEIEDKVGRATPRDSTEAALIAAILWTIDGPCADSEEENLEMAEADLAMRMKLRLKEWAGSVLAPSA